MWTNGGSCAEGRLSGRIGTQLESSLVPGFPVAVQPTFWYGTDKETAGGDIQVLRRAMFESIGSI